MTRIKLFSFYLGMVIVSLVNPVEAQKMIDDANEGAAAKAKRNARNRIFSKEQGK